jgi:DNA-binding PadR family transcriptional regulator
LEKDGQRKFGFKVLAYYYFFAILEEIIDYSYLGEFELILLLTIVRLGDDGYGVPLSRELSQLRGSDVSIGSVYAALNRLELKGLITSSLGESSPERGGRAKRYFRVTEEGLLSVKETRRSEPRIALNRTVLLRFRLQYQVMNCSIANL